MSIEKIRIEDLADFVESKNINSLDKTATSLFIEAQNDWRTSHDSIHDFINELMLFVGDELSEESVQLKLSLLKPNKHAWEMESLTSILEFLRLTKTKNVEEYFEQCIN